mmetsp:Transcript_3742/g.9473  ORF Transcript_3742/g.9473 Transcript_3742/m.9473 type:complete len:253 (+) Transcript_3742:516-1274(+)
MPARAGGPRRPYPGPGHQRRQSAGAHRLLRPHRRAVEPCRREPSAHAHRPHRLRRERRHLQGLDPRCDRLLGHDRPNLGHRYRRLPARAGGARRPRVAHRAGLSVPGDYLMGYDRLRVGGRERRGRVAAGGPHRRCSLGGHHRGRAVGGDCLAGWHSSRVGHPSRQVLPGSDRPGWHRQDGSESRRAQSGRSIRQQRCVGPGVGPPHWRVRAQPGGSRREDQRPCADGGWQPRGHRVLGPHRAPVGPLRRRR